MLLSALSECPIVRFFFLLYACVFSCLSVYVFVFVLLFDVGVLGLHFLCLQRVFIVYCMLPGWCFVFWSCTWFQWHMLCVFSFFVDIFCILSAIYMIVYVCLGSCVYGCKTLFVGLYCVLCVSCAFSACMCL